MVVANKNAWTLGDVSLENQNYVPESGGYSVTAFRDDPVVVRNFEIVSDYLAENMGVGSALIDQATLGKQDDVVEYQRDFTGRIGANFSRAAAFKDAPEHVKEAQRELNKRFDAADLSGMGEWAGAIKDYAIDTVFNPEMALSLASIGAAVPTGGASVVARVGVGQAAKVASKKVIGEALAKSTAASAKNPLVSSMAIGSVYGGTGNLGLQDMDIALDNREGYSGTEVAATALLGAGFGAGIYGATKIGKKYFQRGTDSSEDISIENAVNIFDDSIKDGKIPSSANDIIVDLEKLRGGKGGLPKTVSSLLENTSSSIYLNVTKLTKQMGGGEQTKEELLDIIKNAADGATTAEAIKHKVMHGIYKKSSMISGQLFGKAAGVLSPMAKLSGTAKVLQAKFSYEFGIDWFKKSTKVVGKDLSENQREITGRFNERFRGIVEGISLHSAKGTMAEDINNVLMLSLRGNQALANNGLDAATNKAINGAAKEIKILYNDMGNQLQEIGVIDKLVDNYIPRMWDRKAIEANQQKLADLLETKGGFSKGEGEQAVRDMLAIKDQIDGGGTGGHFFSAKRKLNQIENDADFQEFLNNDVLGSLHMYTFQAGKSLAKHRTLGVNSLGDFKNFYIPRIRKELGEKGEKLSQSEEDAILQLYKTATGEGMERYGKKTQTAVDVYGFANRVAMLPLATVSSLTEVFINISKVGVRKSIKGFNEALEISWKGVTKDLESTLKSNHNLTAKEAFSEMTKFSINMDQAMAQLGDRLAGAELVNETLQNVSNKFFRVTMLDQWTKFVQTTSYASGKLLIRENIEALSANAGKPLNKRLETMAGELAELGIDYKKGIKWFKGGAKQTDEFYDSQVLGGAARYTNSVILQPTSMSGLKPLLHSNPKTAIAFQLLGYPVAFTNTVLKGAAKQLSKDPVRNTAKIVTAATIMTGMARWTNYVRSGGTSEEGKDLDEILYSSIARWGGNGILLDTFKRAQKTAMYSQNPAAFAAMPFGPVASDALNLFQQGVIPVVGQKLPFYTAFAPAMDAAGLDGRDRMRTYRKYLQDVQKRMSQSILPQFEESAPVLNYATGGEVEVPNAPAEPDERVDKLTGRPYNEQAGEAYMDKEDKIKLNKGGVLKPKLSPIEEAIIFSVGSLVNTKEVFSLASKIEKQLSLLETTSAVNFKSPKALSYIKSLVVNALEAPSFKSINDLEKIPSWKKAVEAFNNKPLWEKAQKDLGVTNKQQVALETIAKSSEEVDPEGAIDSVVTPMLSSLAYTLKKSKEKPISKDSLKNMNMAAGERVKKDLGGIVLDTLRSAFLKKQQSWEGDHGNTPQKSNDAQDVVQGRETFDIAFGHKIQPSEMETGLIHGIPFKDLTTGKYISLTDGQANEIQRKDVQRNLELARTEGWDKKLNSRGLSYDSLSEPHKLVLEDLAYNVGGRKAGTTWDGIFESIKNEDTKGIVGHLRRKTAGKNTAGMDNRAAKAAYAAGLIENLQQAKDYGLSLANTNEIPF
tara:strand:+ start:4861 stop:9348 length:4488 start_codon:yes stop_codon:yes gene_type:complete